ncbi:hypothetical protein HPP92_018631 [Vanilla planifolia]|uniref:Uncharacterized protein n=1 Tax=Vanilla planifolia TaxID=51239 RepID=A0A835QDB9_VANPL|nr:hypothetical protein HPP92_018631 [Vanilla planifolia]
MKNYRENWTIEPSEGFLEIDLWLKGHPIVTVVAVLTVSVDGSVSADDRIQSTIQAYGKICKKCLTS